MSFFGSVLGFRSKTPWKMMSAGLFYLGVVIAMFLGRNYLIFGFFTLVAVLAVGIVGPLLSQSPYGLRRAIQVITLCSILFAGFCLWYLDQVKLRVQEIDTALSRAESTDINEPNFISVEDRQAIHCLKEFFNACNANDLARIKRIDIRGLSDDQYFDFLNKARNFKLHYVGVAYWDEKVVSGRMLCSYELQQVNAPGKNIGMEVSSFVLFRDGREWKLAVTKTYDFKKTGMDAFACVFNMKETSKRRYGTDDLMELSY